MRINFSTFNYGGERPVPKDGSLLIPLDENGKIEPIQDRKEFDRLHSLINEENFLGSLIPEKISIGLNNIKFDKDSQLFKINVQDQVYFPEDNKPKGEKSSKNS
jgi:hypothetical protein